ncbi:hypothetical protein SAMN06893096_101593 [Geodermatophilus pulveris]|uniref:Uncharacterized protein n=1 Tax=Geodermatophilus pulveris TaxID=1564159 RepID=A0A239BD66_9ACTN|nr:hypothetical protein [Geodermatophilus pulveris]SNS05501.1 hypothetical protein SAMN06893096_101593 [Geodermatophilus pulveris]
MPSGRPAGGGARPRPPHVLMAGVAGFVQATLVFVVALYSLSFSGQAALFALIGVAALGLTAACLWGAVAALRGRTRRVLITASTLVGLVALAGLAVGFAAGVVAPLPSLLALLAVGAVVLLLQAPSREWFAASRGGPG